MQQLQATAMVSYVPHSFESFLADDPFLSSIFREHDSSNATSSLDEVVGKMI